MKRALLLLALALSTASSALTAVTSANVNLRRSPGTAGAVLTVLPRSTAVQVGACTTWCAVTAGTRHGYVARSLLRFPAPPAVPHSPAPASGTYTNVDGQRIQRPVVSSTVPGGASAQCRDGSYSFSTHRRGTCSHHGGVATWY